MSRLEPADKIEAIVGAKRHERDHLGRAISAEQRVYILHSRQCTLAYADLRKCPYSVALDLGIDMSIWTGFEDRVVTLAIADDDYGDLLPLITSDTPSAEPAAST
ncbi:hypothetical protein [Microbacterium sp.]|uniref:hypothetical protein n=1 Tax=Microbacterium sp. TaxID=51671 RepID=UPI003F7219A1